MNEEWIDGLLLVDKPTGPTSHDVVDVVRRRLRRKRVGHAGTLDPFASGLLVVATGRATRLLRFIAGEPKRYTGILRLGVRTDSDDRTGEPTHTHDGPLPALPAVMQAAAGLVGRYPQTPPAVSARKIDGKRLYRLARRGQTVEAPPRMVDVEAFDLTPLEDGRFAFSATVSGGTYIRAMARDLGEVLGCGGHVEALRRTASGPLVVDQALPCAGLQLPEELSPGWRALDRIPLGIPSITLQADCSRRFLHGVAVPAEPESPAGPCGLLSPEGALLGVAETDGARLRPLVVLAGPEGTACR